MATVAVQRASFAGPPLPLLSTKLPIAPTPPPHITRAALSTGQPGMPKLWCRLDPSARKPMLHSAPAFTHLHVTPATLPSLSGTPKLWGWVDASGPKPMRKGLYQLAKSYAADVDGYSYILDSGGSSLPTGNVSVGDKDLCQDQKPKRNMVNSPVKIAGKSTNIVWQECMVKKEERQKLLGQTGCVIWITGLSGSGKSTLACTLDHALVCKGKLSYVLDGDNIRHGLNKNLGFTADDRMENIRRVGEVAKLLVDAGIICIVSVISPYRKDRDACRKLFVPGEFIEVYMNFPLSLCEQRDPKGLYKLARAGKIKGFTGIDDPYEAPLNCEIVMEPVGGRCPTPDEMATHLMTYLEAGCFLQYAA